MCSYITEKVALFGSAKGPNGWMSVDTANVYFDHPYHVPLDHALTHRFRQRGRWRQRARGGRIERGLGT